VAAIENALRLRLNFHHDLMTPRADAESTLATIRRSNRKIGLISNCSSEVPEIWAQAALARDVDAAIFSCEVGCMKPDAAIFELACERLGIPAEECLYVGDGADGELEGAEAAGMNAVLLEPGDTEPPTWTGQRVTKLAEVVPLALGDRP
jgi:putative hydrolase of the HAD superfamily